jgi:hypothetical protein
MGHMTDGDREALRQRAFAADAARLVLAMRRADATMRRIMRGEVTHGAVQDLAGLASSIEQGLELIEADELMQRPEQLPPGGDQLLRVAIAVMHAGGVEGLGALAKVHAATMIGYDSTLPLSTNDVCLAIREYLDGPA